MGPADPTKENMVTGIVQEEEKIAVEIPSHLPNRDIEACMLAANVFA